MSYSYPLTMPATPEPRFHKFRLVRRQSVNDSPQTGKLQITEHLGAFWEIELQYAPMARATAAAWEVFFAMLHGCAGTFYCAYPDGNLRGSGLGTPVVAAGGFAADYLSVDTSGWTASEEGVLLAGDKISFSNYEFKEVIEDVDADGSGLATVKFEPIMRSVVGTGTAIATSGAKGIFRLLTPDIEYSSDHLMKYGIAFMAREDIS